MRERQRAAKVGALRLACLAAAAATCQAALAAPPELRSEGGLLVLPNVRVEMASQPVDGKGAAVKSAGMKAFKDRETGLLRPALPEDALDTSAAAGAKSAAPSRLVVSGARKSATVDEAFMSYAVVRKDESGSLEMSCVPGEDKALQVLRSKPVDAKEYRHAH